MQTRPGALTIAVVGIIGALAAATQQPAPAAPPAAQTTPAQPTILLAPGLREVPDYRKVDADPPPARFPTDSRRSSTGRISAGGT
jgi:hypothetical protein